MTNYLLAPTNRPGNVRPRLQRPDQHIQHRPDSGHDRRALPPQTRAAPSRAPTVASWRPRPHKRLHQNRRVHPSIARYRAGDAQGRPKLAESGLARVPHVTAGQQHNRGGELQRRGRLPQPSNQRWVID